MCVRVRVRVCVCVQACFYTGCEAFILYSMEMLDRTQHLELSALQHPPKKQTVFPKYAPPSPGALSSKCCGLCVLSGSCMALVRVKVAQHSTAYVCTVARAWPWHE